MSTSAATVLQSVRAPGKAMLFGEYAVLAGAPALVAAVDRYVTVEILAEPAGAIESPPASDFVREAQRARLEVEIARGFKPRLAALRVDSAPLYVAGGGGGRGRKLGLGSSAAVVAAVFGTDDDLAPGAIWLACEAAHTRAQGARGSGADLAAAIWGGVIRFSPPRAPGQPPEVRAITLAADLDVTLVDAGEAASTADRVAALAALKSRDTARYAKVLAPLLELAESVAAEAEAHGRVPFESVEAWNAALADLESAIGHAILTEPLRAIAAAAREAGGAAKPSGAGGGDLAVCFTPRAAREALSRALAARGFGPLDVHIGARGLHLASAAPR